MQTLGSFSLKHTFAPKQISSDPAGRRLAQCAGFFSPLPSLARYRPPGPGPFLVLFPGPGPKAERPVGYRPLASRPIPPSSAAGRRLPPDPRARPRPKGGRLEQRLRGRRMCVTGRVGRGREEARGNPGPAAGNPGSKITGEGGGGGAPTHLRGGRG